MYGVFLLRDARRDYQFDQHGITLQASITDCTFSTSKSGSSPWITYQYEVGTTLYAGEGMGLRVNIATSILNGNYWKSNIYPMNLPSRGLPMRLLGRRALALTYSFMAV